MDNQVALSQEEQKAIAEKEFAAARQAVEHTSCLEMLFVRFFYNGVNMVNWYYWVSPTQPLKRKIVLTEFVSGGEVWYIGDWYPNQK